MKSRQRVIDHGEVFTPPKLVNDMLDLVAAECERIDSRFLEPACGDGNFLDEVLRRKLRTVNTRNQSNRPNWERDAIVAVSSIYGIDLLSDNVAACQARLLARFVTAYVDRFRDPPSEEIQRTTAFILSRNIVQGDALTFRNADGRPIVLSEWSPLNGTLLKRRDFSYDHLLDHAHSTQAGGLFSDMGHAVYLPEPVAEFPPCHYWKIAEGHGES